MDGGSIRLKPADPSGQPGAGGSKSRRLDQLLSSLGYCSRSEARGWIDAGMVTIGERVADDPSERCAPANVRIEGEPLDHPDGLLLLLNKPAGVVCSHNLGEGPRVYDLLPERWQRRNPAVTSIGRLDRDTTGLLLLTDQTLLVHQLTSPKNKVPKIYSALLDKDVGPTQSNEITARFASGDLLLEGETDPCRPASVRWLDSRRAEITLVEGRYHQVRRMFAAEGLTVVTLHRDRFGSLTVSDLPPGHWRDLPLDQTFV